MKRHCFSKSNVIVSPVFVNFYLEVQRIAHDLQKGKMKPSQPTLPISHGLIQGAWGLPWPSASFSLVKAPVHGRVHK